MITIQAGKIKEDDTEIAAARRAKEGKQIVTGVTKPVSHEFEDVSASQ